MGEHSHKGRHSGDIERWSPLAVWLYSLGARTPPRSMAAVDLLELGPGDRFLDLGCGLGAGLAHATTTGASVAGVDPSPSMVKKAGERVQTADVREGSAESIPFPDDSFTAVMSVAAFHHWADPKAGLREVRRVLAPGGRLLILEAKLKRKGGHGLHPESGTELAAELETMGYEGPRVDVQRVDGKMFVAVSARKSAPLET